MNYEVTITLEENENGLILKATYDTLEECCEFIQLFEKGFSTTVMYTIKSIY